MIEKSMLENVTEAKGERNQTEVLPLLPRTCAVGQNKTKQFSDSKLKKSPNRFSCVSEE